jgi:hypothetical protein
MTSRQTTLERAFTLARSGEYAGVSEIRTQLKAEGYAMQQLEGPSLMKQLRDLCLQARQGKAPEPDQPPQA